MVVLFYLRGNGNGCNLLLLLSFHRIYCFGWSRMNPRKRKGFMFLFFIQVKENSWGWYIFFFSKWVNASMAEVDKVFTRLAIKCELCVPKASEKFTKQRCKIGTSKALRKCNLTNTMKVVKGVCAFKTRFYITTPFCLFHFLVSNWQSSS